MSFPPSITLGKPRVHRKRRGTSGANPPTPATLSLLAVIFPTGVTGSMDLVFDRAIDISGFDGTQIILKDGIYLSAICNATGPAELINPQTVRVFLVSLEDYFESNQLLTASGTNGIVAVEGGEWSGVTELVLPWP